MALAAVASSPMWSVVASFLLQAAGAVPAADPRIPAWEQSSLKETSRAVRVMYMFAVCTVHRRKAAAEALLRTKPGSDEQAAVLKQVLGTKSDSNTPCLADVGASRLRLRGNALFRGAIAEAFYNGKKVRPRSAAPLTQSDLSDGFGSSPQSKIDGPLSEASNDDVGLMVSECAVRKDPMGVHTVLQWRPGSPGETKALNALEPMFVSCLPSGRSLDVSRLTMRALLSEAIYQESRQSKDFFVNA